MALTLATFAMGTRFELVLAGLAPARLRAAGEAALAEIELWEQRLSRFRRDSWLAHLERHALERGVELDAEAAGLLAACAEVRRASGGAFSVWQAAGGPAGPGAGASKLDFGAVGKGFALDCARERLREAGVQQALLHGGTSSVATLGAPPGMPGWRVALERGEGSPVVELRDLALGVSAQHGGHGATEGGHVRDARGGPAPPGERIAAVVHSSALLADAWSTALLVLGILPDAAPRELAGLVGAGSPGARLWRACGARSQAFQLDHACAQASS